MWATVSDEMPSRRAVSVSLLPISARNTFDRCLAKPVSPGALLEVVAEFTLRAKVARGVLEKLQTT